MFLSFVSLFTNENFISLLIGIGGPTTEIVCDLKGQTGFTLTASLRGGRGDVAWQHTQLFRQSSEDLTSYPFEVRVKFQ